jgi:predicted metal-binding membrane protein
MVATYVSIQRGRRARAMPAAPAGTVFFVAGYLVAWSAAGLVCYAVLRVGQLVADDAMFWQQDGRWVSASVLALAAVYELTPAKYACLRRCRGPVAFLLGHWRDGRLGALRMGGVHGLWCVGCCWGLMAALVALGLMSLGWMAVVALVIAVEKLVPHPRWATGSVAALLALAAVAVAVG